MWLSAGLPSALRQNQEPVVYETSADEETRGQSKEDMKDWDAHEEAEHSQSIEDVYIDP